MSSSAIRTGRDVSVVSADGYSTAAASAAAGVVVATEAEAAEAAAVPPCSVGGRGVSTRSFGEVILASAVSGGGLMDGAGISRAKEILPWALTCSYEAIQQNRKQSRPIRGDPRPIRGP